MKESTLQAHVIKLLDAFGRQDIVYFHPANGEYRSKRTAARLKLMGVKAGVADLIFLIDGKFFGLELKTTTGQPSTDQEAFAQAVERAGGTCFLANGIDEAIGVLRGINAFRPGIQFALGKGMRGEPARSAKQSRRQSQRAKGSPEKAKSPRETGRIAALPSP